MIRSNFEDLRRRKSYEEKRKLTLRTIADESGLSLGTVHRVSSGKLEKIHLSTFDALCQYFKVQSLLDLIEFVPEQGKEL